MESNRNGKGEKKGEKGNRAPSSCSAASTSGPRLATDDAPVMERPRPLCPSPKLWLVAVTAELARCPPRRPAAAAAAAEEEVVDGRGGGSLTVRSVATKGLGCGSARRGLGSGNGPVYIQVWD